MKWNIILKNSVQVNYSGPSDCLPAWSRFVKDASKITSWGSVSRGPVTLFFAIFVKRGVGDAGEGALRYIARSLAPRVSRKIEKKEENFQEKLGIKDYKLSL
jgi:hypothetical protein